MRIFLKGEASSSRSGGGRHQQKPVGEIMEYVGITIDWIRGKKAVLTIYDSDGKATEDVPLYELKTRDEMHKLMIEKGFRKKTQQEKEDEILIERREKQLRQIDASSGPFTSFYNTLTGLYLMVFFVVLGRYSTVRMPL